jgi:hypothetical protein
VSNWIEAKWPKVKVYAFQQPLIVGHNSLPWISIQANNYQLKPSPVLGDRHHRSFQTCKNYMI